MLTKGAIGNLVNRYRAVLKKCNLMNTFGSLAVASMLVLGGAGVAGAADLILKSDKYGDLRTAVKEATLTSSDNVSLTYESTNNGYYPAAIAEPGTLNIDVKNLTISSTSKGIAAKGDDYITINAAEDISIDTTSGKEAALHLVKEGGAHAGAITLNANGNITLQSKGYVIHNNSDGIVNIDADGDFKAVTGSGISNNGTGALTIDAKNITIESTTYYGVISLGSGGIDLTAEENVVIKNEGTYAAVQNRDGTVNITAGNGVSIEGDIVKKAGAADINITAEKGSMDITGDITISSGKLNLTAKTGDIEIKGNVHGDASASMSAKVDIKGNNITITSASGAGQAESTDGVIRNVDIEATGKVTIAATGNLSGVGAGPDDATRPHTENSIKAKEIEITSENSFGVYANNHSYHASGTREHFKLEAETINITSKKDGILVMNGAEAAVTGFDTLNITSAEQGIGSEYGGLTIEGGKLLVDATEEGIRSKLGGDLAINTELLKVEAGLESIKLTGDSELTIESGTTQLDGDIVTETYNGKNASLTVNFDGKDSYLNGNVTTVEGANTHLAFNNGGTWKSTAASSVSKMTMNDGVLSVMGLHTVSIGNLSGTGGTLNALTLLEDGVLKTGNVDIASFGSATTYRLMRSTAATPSFNVVPVDANGNPLTADDLNQSQLAEVISQTITGDAGEDIADDSTATVAAGIVNDTVTVNNNGEVVAGGGASDVTKAMLEAASVNTVSLDRILTNDVRKRMGDLRSDKNEAGVWMRWDGGKLKGDSGLTNNFNTIQIGGDTKVAKNCRLGVAGSFTHGDSEFDRGNGQLEGFSFATYATWMGDNGMFADVVARLGKFSTEMNVEGLKGDMDNRVFSLSGEYGWRFDLCNQFFVEPQVELAYTYVSSDDLQFGDATYQFDNVDSLTGRAGLVAGWNLPNDMGNVYARASVLQQFMGDAKVTGHTAAGATIHETDGDDTWLEYGIGANVKLTDKAYIWADVERTEGAEIEEEWRGTVGIRYSF